MGFPLGSRRALLSFLLMLLGFVLNTKCFSDSEYPWSYECIENTLDGPACQRKEVPAESIGKVPLNICILTCGQYGPLWPYPSLTILGKELTAFGSLDQINFMPTYIPEPDEKLLRMIGNSETIFKSYIEKLIPEDYTNPGAPNGSVSIQIVIKSLDSKFTLDTDESYNLTTISSGNKVFVTIEGISFFGVRHGLETLSQLIDFDAEKNVLQVVNTAIISDAPVFKYRGLLMDTARNFIPISDLKRLIDGLSFNKMNIFHWHMTDSNSFPFFSKRVPLMVKYGTYGSKKIYYPEEISELLTYANQRGVKIIPEFDLPAHAGNGWQWSVAEGLGELSLCLNAEPYQTYCIQPPCGQLNPLNNNTYSILGELFRDFLDVFDTDIFHMGGDEISFKCWMAYEEITDWLIEHNSTDLMELWGLFQENAHAKLKEANGGKRIDAIVWTSEMTSHARNYIPPEDYIIQIWSKTIDNTTKGIYEEGYRVIFSNNDTVYLDHGYGPWRGNYVNPAVLIKTWQQIYANDILGQVQRQVGAAKTKELLDSGRLMGGVATLWSEKADPYNMDMKLWPRGSAYAERLWSNPPVRLNVTQLAYPRLIHMRERLVQRGLKADVLLPEGNFKVKL